MIEKSRQINVWGNSVQKGVGRVVDIPPILSTPEINGQDKMKLLFYPEKFLLYNFVRKALVEKRKENKETGRFSKLKVLEVGCESGASIIDIKKMWGKEIEIYGVDNVSLQVDLAKRKIKEHGVWAEIGYYDGNLLPFKNDFFDVVISSGELNKVLDTYNWLEEISRVLLPGGRLALSCDSKLGKNSYIANYLDKRGVDIDENSDNFFQSKQELESILEQNNFQIKRMFNTFGSSFVLHPEKYFPMLEEQKKFFFWKMFNKLFYFLKKKSPLFLRRFFSLCLLFKIWIVGRFWEDKGYVVLAKKN